MSFSPPVAEAAGPDPQQIHPGGGGDLDVFISAMKSLAQVMKVGGRDRFKRKARNKTQPSEIPLCPFSRHGVLLPGLGGDASLNAIFRCMLARTRGGF